MRFRHILKSKIHRAIVTEANIAYEGSITIDEDLMEAADLLPHEKVQIANLNNGTRLETYVIKGARGSGVICMNGAAAHHARVGDAIHIISYQMLTAEEASAFKPIVIHVNQANKLLTPSESALPDQHI